MSRRVRFRDLLPAGVVLPPPDPIFSPDEKGQEPNLLRSIFSPNAAGGASRFLAPIQQQQRKNRPPSLAESSSPLQQKTPTQAVSPSNAVSPGNAEGDDGHNYDSDYNNDHNSSSGWWPKESPRSDAPAVHSNDLVTPQKNSRKNRSFQKHKQHIGGDPSFRSKQRNNTKQQSPASFGDVSEILVSPSNTALSSLAVSPSSLDLSAFENGAALASSPASINRSIVSTSTAFRTLEKMEWLELDKIQQCTSIPQLVRIISVLQAEKTPYPSLLRAARERLVSLRPSPPPLAVNSMASNNSNTAAAELESPPKVDLRQHQPELVPCSPDTVIADLSKSHLTNDDEVPGLDKSSLVMSLSTTDMEEEEYLSCSAPTNSALWQAHKPALSQSNHFWVQQHPASERECELREQVERLTQTIIEMEQLTLPDSSLRYRNVQKEIEIQLLPQCQVQSDADTKNLLQSVEELRQQNQTLQEQIQRESADREKKRRASADMESRLFSQLHQLQMQLTQAQGKTAKDQSSFQRKQFELNQTLRTAQRNLERIKADRDTLIQCLLQATGRSANDNALSSREQKRLMEEICHRAASNQRELDHMAQQMTESDRHRQIAVLAQRKSEIRLSRSVKSAQRLQHENSVLMGQIQSLSEELRATRKQLDEIYSSGQAMQRKEFEERERNYKHIIKEMKEQLRNSENVVSLEIYQKAMAEVEQRTVECQYYQQDASTLASKVVKLEKELKLKKQPENQKKAVQNAQPPPPPPPPPLQLKTAKASAVAPPPPSTSVIRSTNSSVSRERERPHRVESSKPTQALPAETAKVQMKKVRIVSPKRTSPKSNEDEQSPRFHRPVPRPGIENVSKTPGKGSQASASQPTTPKRADRCKLRSSAVRAAGGRIALQKKLRDMRSPKPLEHYNRKLEQMGIRPLPLRETINKNR